MLTIEELRRDYNWQQAFLVADAYNPLTRQTFPRLDVDDVVEILALSEGENDGPNWLGAFKLRDGRYAYLSAGCDYTGWDCQASGAVEVHATREDMLACIPSEDRERLELR